MITIRIYHDREWRDGDEALSAATSDPVEIDLYPSNLLEITTRWIWLVPS
jgi:hypothetical protein